MYWRRAIFVFCFLFTSVPSVIDSSKTTLTHRETQIHKPKRLNRSFAVQVMIFYLELLNFLISLLIRPRKEWSRETDKQTHRHKRSSGNFLRSGHDILPFSPYLPDLLYWFVQEKTDRGNTDYQKNINKHSNRNFRRSGHDILLFSSLLSWLPVLIRTRQRLIKEDIDKSKLGE